MFELLKRGSEYSIKLLLEVNHELTSFGFSSFWLTVFGEIRLFMVLRYRLFALSFRYNAQNKT